MWFVVKNKTVIQGPFSSYNEASDWMWDYRIKTGLGAEFDVVAEWDL